MRPYTSLLTAACLGASLCFSASALRAADNLSTTDNTAQNLHRTPNENPNYTIHYPAGIQAKDLHAMNDVRDAFKTVTTDAFGKNPLNDIIKCTVDQDRSRLENNNMDKSRKDNNDQLGHIVQQLDTAWHAKYNQNFSLDASKVYLDTFLHIGTGEVTNPDQLVGHWPVSATDNAANATGQMTAQDAKDAHKNFGGDVNLEKGRNVAIAHVVGSHGMPGITASLIHELPGSWRFDVPNTLTREKLYSNLVANLTHLYNNQAQWPADSAEAYRAATHAVVASLYDINLDQTLNNMPQAAGQSSTPMHTANEK
jgi:hypothetical protein